LGARPPRGNPSLALPDVNERAAILVVDCQGKRLAPDVDLGAVARGTPGFSGADLANLANEAAIVAVRGDREVIMASDFDAARDRIILGRREGSNVLLPEEKHAVAVHESGHALVAAPSEHADPMAKVTIQPIGYPEGGSVFLGGDGPGLSSRPYAEATQATIDVEVSKLLRQAEERAVELLKTHRSELDELVDLLLVRETVDGADVYLLADRQAAAPAVPRR
jgi:ATP-dependent Zn protease